MFVLGYKAYLISTIVDLLFLRLLLLLAIKLI